MIGVTYFPICRDGEFVASVKIMVTKHAVEGHTYVKIGSKSQLHYPPNFARNVDAMLSITSSYMIAIEVGSIRESDNVYISIPLRFDFPIGGASEGLAMLLAFLGVSMPEQTMATGFIDMFGIKNISKEDMMKLPVKKIDSAGAKAKGAKECNLTLLLPCGNVTEEIQKLSANIISIETVGDAINALK